MVFNLLAIGNPGTGKSTLLNCHAGAVMFAAGMSYGGGLTSDLAEYECGNIKYIDTPGLADEELRKQAARAISRALKSGGVHKIIFFLLSVNGRVRPDDKATMKLVLEAAPEIYSQGANKFAVIVNQCSAGFVQGIAAPANHTKFVTTLFAGMPAHTCHIWCMPEIAALKDKENALVPLPQDVLSFIARVPTVQLTKGRAADVRDDTFESVNRAMEELRRKMDADANLRQQQAAAAAREAQRLQKLYEAEKNKPPVIQHVHHHHSSGGGGDCNVM